MFTLDHSVGHNLHPVHLTVALPMFSANTISSESFYVEAEYKGEEVGMLDRLEATSISDLS